MVELEFVETSSRDRSSRRNKNDSSGRIGDSAIILVDSSDDDEVNEEAGPSQPQRSLVESSNQMSEYPPEVHDAAFLLLNMFPTLLPEMVYPELTREWLQFSPDVVMQRAVDRLLVLQQDLLQGDMVNDEAQTVNGGKAGKGKIVHEQGESSRKTDGTNNGMEAEAETQPDLEAYNAWSFYRLADEFPLIPFSVIRRAFHHFYNSEFSPTYKAVLRACKELTDSRKGKKILTEDATVNDERYLRWRRLTGRIRLMKVPRVPRKTPDTACPRFEEEWAALQKDFQELSRGGFNGKCEGRESLERGEVDGASEEPEPEPEPGGLECGCCCIDYSFEKMVQCADGHLFCSECLRRHVEEMTFGGYKIQSHLPCMDTNGCKESIPFSELQRTLPEDILKKYEERQAQHALLQAKLDHLVYCPFCNFPCEVDDDVRVLHCLECKKGSCIECKEPDHTPLMCEEVEKDPETAARKKVEEMMTKAVIRECNSCKAPLVKRDGCNKVTCTCGAIICYVCRQTIRDYSHFCTHVRNPGQTCTLCTKCGLWDQEIEDDVILSAKDEALGKLALEEPHLRGKLIGPPIKKSRAPANRHIPQPLPFHPVNPPIYNWMPHLPENLIPFGIQIQPLQPLPILQPQQPFQLMQAQQPIQPIPPIPPMAPIPPIQPIQPMQPLQPIQPLQPMQHLAYLQRHMNVQNGGRADPQTAARWP